MKAEKILAILKRKKLSQLRREFDFNQAIFVSFMVTFFITLIQIIKDIFDGAKILGTIAFLVFLTILILLFGLRFANSSLLVELKEEKVHKWKREKALDYINEEREGL